MAVIDATFFPPLQHRTRRADHYPPASRPISPTQNPSSPTTASAHVPDLCNPASSIQHPLPRQAPTLGQRGKGEGGRWRLEGKSSSHLLRSPCPLLPASLPRGQK